MAFTPTAGIPVVVHLAVVPDQATRAQLNRIEGLLVNITNTEKTIMADLTGLTAEVERNTTVEQSALTLIQGLAAELAAAGTDPAKLAALQAQLTSNDDALAAAVAANTAAPAPPSA